MMEWLKEPNELRWNAHGFECLLKRGPGGHWCGYVGVPPEHPLYGADYNKPLAALEPLLGQRSEMPLGETPSVPLLLALMVGSSLEPTMSIAFNVHGGVTYAGTGFEKRDLGLWWIGFDCAHSGDLIPNYETGCGIYRNLSYARSETERLAMQVARCQKVRVP